MVTCHKFSIIKPPDDSFRITPRKPAVAVTAKRDSGEDCNSPASDPPRTGSQTGVTVVVCCYNSARRLPETLSHLAVQKTSGNIPWEIVLVDNGSTDGTASLARSLWDGLNCGAPLKVITESSPGLNAARAAGIENSSYEYMVFCDDDNWLHEGYVQRVFERLTANGNIGILGGRNVAVFETPPPAWFDQEKEAYAVGEQGRETGDISKRKFVFGAGMALRKSVWIKLAGKGYRSFLSDRKGNSLSSGGDSEICAWHLREGYILFYDEHLTLRHYIETHRLEIAYLERLKTSLWEANHALRAYHSLLERPPGIRKPRDVLTGILQFVQGVAAYPFSRKTGGRKLAKSQIAFGTRIRINPNMHNILSHYANTACSEIHNPTHEHD